MTSLSSNEIMTLKAPATAERWPSANFSESWLKGLAADLQQFFCKDFSLWNGETGDLLLAAPHEPAGDEILRAELARAAARRTEQQFVADEGDVLLLALPCRLSNGQCCVALGAFATGPVPQTTQLTAAARLLGLSEEATRTWWHHQSIWKADLLSRMGAAVLAKRRAEADVVRYQQEVEQIADNLAVTYEEITLLYSVTQNLRISSSDDETGRFALQSLIGAVSAEGFAVQLLPVAEHGKTTYKARTESTLIAEGDCPITNEEFSQLIAHLELAAGASPYVANETVTASPDWPFPAIRQVIIVPMAEGANVFGWLAAFNHVKGQEFNTVEASLLGSVGVMLGIHSGNRELYRQQAELLASVVCALSSAIDAKDPYTCGHSDRVARIAVRLAKELGHDPEYLNTVYMSGLLHDVGKIGIQESVLRKPDKLTNEEYEHIKLHPELGYRILAGIHHLRDVLPGVLHHHEQWNGKGYPHKLAGEGIPRIARIMAVADAYDAMFSSRPYRPGMPEARVEKILQEGAGEQWDAEVVAAYFRARDDIREIGSNERANLSLDVKQWS